MPPPNTPEEFFADEYRTAVHNAGRNRSQRFPLTNLPPHDEDSAESDVDGVVLDLDIHDIHSHPNTSQSESRRNSIERRMSHGHRDSTTDSGIHTRSDSRDGSIPDARPLTDLVSSSPPNPAFNLVERYGLLGPSVAPPSSGTGTVSPQQNQDQNQNEAEARAADRNQEQSQNQNAIPSVRSPPPNDNNDRWSTQAHDNYRTPHSPWTRQDGEALRQRLAEDQAEVDREYADMRRERREMMAHLQEQAGLPPRRSHRRSHRHSRTQPKPASKTPELDWHALEYIGPYDENLDCPICRAPLVKPLITTCMHIFCAKCLYQALRHSSRCPIDRNTLVPFTYKLGEGDSEDSPPGPVTAKPAPNIISNQLDNLQVRCPNRRCDHTSARASIKEHYETECAYTKIACPDPSCDKLVTRRDSEEGSCLHKAVDCVYCGKPVELAALDDHYDTDCNQKELMCEHCLAAVPRHRHGTHVTDCAERRIECKFRTSGCAFTSKKKDFGDHERTCLYGMIMRMNRAHRADMDSMETVLQDSQDRVRKLEAEMAARPAPAQAVAQAAPAPPNTQTAAATVAAATAQQPNFYEFPSQHPNLQGQVYTQTQPTLDPHHDLSRYYDAVAAGDASLAQANANASANGSATRPGTPPAGGALVQAQAQAQAPGLGPDDNNSDDRMNRIVAYIDIFDAKVENLERYLGEVDARQAQMFMNELGPLKEQILEMRNTMGHISMYVRWLMESFRQTTKRSVGLRGEEGGPSGPSGPSPTTAGASSASAAGPSTATPRPPVRAPAGNPGGMGMSLPTRRMSDRENPPRL